MIRPFLLLALLAILPTALEGQERPRPAAIHCGTVELVVQALQVQRSRDTDGIEQWLRVVDCRRATGEEELHVEGSAGEAGKLIIMRVSSLRWPAERYILERDIYRPGG